MKKCKIRVTKNDIRWGVRCSSYNCPIANAVNRQLADITEYASVGYNSVVIRTAHNSRVRRRFHLSNKATNFIKRFDKGKPVEPTTFLLERN